MTVYRISVYLNIQSWFMPYRDGHVLMLAVSHVRDQPATDWDDIAGWAFRVFNDDLDSLQLQREEPGGEADLLIACVYRLLGHRSLSVGDVVHVATDEAQAWLACESVGWRRIRPPVVTGQLQLIEQVCAELEQRRGI